MDSSDDDYGTPVDTQPPERHATNAYVLLDYDDPKTIPTLEETEHAKRGGQWTRFVCISDTQNGTFDVPDGDVLLHAGDLTHLGLYADFAKTMEWIYALPHKIKIIIAGNHDIALDQNDNWYQENYSGWHEEPEDHDKIMELMIGPKAKAANVVYLEGATHTFSVGQGRREWSIYGSPWSPYFYNWAFNYHRDKGKEVMSDFPRTDILLTHSPPAGVYDYTTSGEFAGCTDLAAALTSGRLRPLLHVFGHIHEGRGAYIHSWDNVDALSRAPATQNQMFDDDMDDDMFDDSAAGEEAVVQKEVAEMAELAQERSMQEGLQRTVFVNAANWPEGRGTWKNGVKTQRGGRGFQPIVVDLLE